MDPESAKLITMLYARAEEMPLLTPIMVTCVVIAVGILVILYKIWVPPKPSLPPVEDELAANINNADASVTKEAA